MNYAYIRVSTQIQSYDGQRYEIESWCSKQGIPIDRWIQEKVSGNKDLEERTLGKLLRRMKRGDLLVCTELSRLGRNMMMVMSILNVCSRKGLRLHSIKDHFELSDELQSKIIAFAFSLAAEIERNLIAQRTKEALAAKKAEGKKLGRPSGKTSQRKRFEEMLPTLMEMKKKGAGIEQLAGMVGVHKNTLYKYFRSYEEEKNEIQKIIK